MRPDRTAHVAPIDQLLKVGSDVAVRAFGGQDAAAAHLRTRQQRISDCVRPNTPDFLRINEVAALEDATHGSLGHPAVTTALARRQGFMLLPEPSAPPSGTDILKLLGEIAGENGELTQSILSSIADRRFTVDELDESIEQAMEQQVVVARLIGVLRVMRADGGATL